MPNNSIPAPFNVYLAFALVVFGCTFSAPAVACLCSSWEEESAAAEARLTEYDQIFSGLVIATERIERVAEAVSSEKVTEDPGYWIKSRILVLRIWRGAAPTVAEVWTPVVTSCDTQPITGFYFVALVRSEEARRVASSTFCDCALKAAATEGQGAFSIAGIAIIAAAVGAAALAILSLLKVFRRRRLSG